VRDVSCGACSCTPSIRSQVHAKGDKRSLASLERCLHSDTACAPLSAVVQMQAPPQPLHLFLCRSCGKMEAPPHSLHVFLCRLCSQMEVPPQSLHLLLTRLCGQMEVPPQSLHVLLSMEPCASCRGCHPRSIEAATAYASTQGTVWKTSLCRQIVMYSLRKSSSASRGSASRPGHAPPTSTAKHARHAAPASAKSVSNMLTPA